MFRQAENKRKVEPDFILSCWVSTTNQFKYHNNISSKISLKENVFVYFISMVDQDNFIQLRRSKAYLQISLLSIYNTCTYLKLPFYATLAVVVIFYCIALINILKMHHLVIIIIIVG